MSNDPVPTNEQGPNEQSIVASGMTVEEWEKLHPGQPLGPNPEDIGQITTDPPDGSELSEEDTLKQAAYFNPAILEDGTPANAEAKQKMADAGMTGGEEESNPNQPPETPAVETPTPAPAPTPPVQEPEEEEDDSEELPDADGDDDAVDRAEAPGEPGAHPHVHRSLSSHAALNDYVETYHVDVPFDWDQKTIVEKKAWLDEQPDSEVD